MDRWLWAVRLFKSRSAATDACRAGHVRINGTVAKPAAPVRVGDRVEAATPARPRVVEVREILATRVGAPLAQAALVDHSPPVDRTDNGPFARPPGAGRPTKRDRRRLDRLRP